MLWGLSWIVVTCCVKLFNWQGEPAQQDEPDDSRQLVHLLLAHSDAARLRDQGDPVDHKAEPGRHWDLHWAEWLLFPWWWSSWELQQWGDTASTLSQHGGSFAAAAAAPTFAAAADPTYPAPRPTHIRARLACWEVGSLSVLPATCGWQSPGRFEVVLCFAKCWSAD